MLQLFKRMLRGPKQVGPETPATLQLVSRSEPAPAVPERAAAPGQQPGWEEFSGVCKLQRTPAFVPGEVEAGEDAALAEQLVAHYQENKPGPESVPALSLQILNLVAAPSMDAQKLARLVAQDPALAANVLRVANSVLNKGVSNIESVRDAIARLGLSEVARIASAVSVRSLFNPKLRAQFSTFEPHFKRLFEDALTTAMAASWLALRKPGTRSDRAYLGGLLHDVGKTIALRSVAALLAEGRIKPRLGSVPRVIEQVHVIIGEDANRAWQMPAFLVQAAAHHHDGQVSADEIADLSCVRLVSALRALKAKDPHQPRAADELVEAAQVLAVSPFELRALESELQLFAVRAAGLVG